TLLHTLVNLTGAHQLCSQIEIQVKNKPGFLGTVIAIFSYLQINIVLVLIYLAKEDKDNVLFFLIQTMKHLWMI
ncbi:acetoin utilization protein AcuB, partial [Bacillus nitratireducens]|nr:acetoin utilization protein AcuB [Bacillus nitratireducens]